MAGVLVGLSLLDTIGSRIAVVGGLVPIATIAAFFLVPDRAPDAVLDVLPPAHWGRRVRQALLGGGVALVVLAGFVPGYHVWATRVEHRSFSGDGLTALRRPTPELLPSPREITHDTARVWSSGASTQLRWRPAGGAIEVTATTDGRFVETSLAPLPADRRPNRMHYKGTARFVDWSLRPVGASWLQFEVANAAPNGAPVTVLNGRATTQGSVRIDYGYGWLLSQVLIQFGAIAFSEETFFRSFVLQRLHRLRGTRPDPRWWHISRANLIASAIFALCHVMIGWDPARAAVFFPSLLFGKLWERTGATSASITLHALSNLMLLAVSSQYAG